MKNNKIFNFYISRQDDKKYLKVVIFGIKLSFSLSAKRGNSIWVKKKDGTLKKVSRINGLNVVFKRSNSKVIVHEPVIKFKNCKASLGENCSIEIGAATKDKLVSINNVVFDLPNKNSKVTIGDNLFFGRGSVVLLADSTLTIGNDCLFSYGITIRIGDGHSIIDLNKNEKIRDAGDVVIGDRVWIGMGATLLKNAGIPNDSIIGASSVVTKKFAEQNIAIAGNPAKIIKTNVAWEK